MDYQAKSKKITLSLLTSPEYQKSRSIHIYQSFRSEPDTQYIINHAKKSSRDIYYPEIDPYHNKLTIDIAIIPGTLFDCHMTRHGRGGGYYDKFLAITNCTKIGLSFYTNIRDTIERKPHDIPMDIIITERGIIRPRYRPLY